VIVVDVVTQRSGNLQAELLTLLQVQASTAGMGARDLYACAHRVLPGATPQLQSWAYELTVGDPLPTMPLWLDADLCLPLELEAAYQAACIARRLDAVVP
jgi:hypothetical protein